MRGVEILDYRETYGGEVRNANWRRQFVGKRPGSALRLDQDIKNISGATLSSRHVTDGVRRLLVTYQMLLAQRLIRCAAAARCSEPSWRSTADCRRRIDSAFAEIERVHRLMSAHEPESELRAINRFAASPGRARSATTRRSSCDRALGGTGEAAEPSTR